MSHGGGDKDRLAKWLEIVNASSQLRIRAHLPRLQFGHWSCQISRRFCSFNNRRMNAHHIFK